MREIPLTASQANDKKIPVMEIFGPTIQGEGHVAGLRTIFIRLGGCDYKCSHCDSMHAVDPDQVKAGAEWLTQGEIGSRLVQLCTDTNTPSVTISGGNPAIHDMTEVVDALRGNNIKVSVETQGTYWRPWLATVDYLTISPKGPGMGIKTDFKVLDEFMSQVVYNFWDMEQQDIKGVCIKVVAFSAQDLDFASDVIQRYNLFDHCDRFYISIGNPHEQELEMPTPDFCRLISTYVDYIIEDMKGFPALRNARLLPQVHTLIWGQAKGK